MDTCDRSGVAYRLSGDDDKDDTVQQIADPFSAPRTTVCGHLNDASKAKRPTIHHKPISPAGASAG